MPAAIPSVVRSVSTAPWVIPSQRRGSGTQPLRARPVHGRDMSLPYTSYDPLRPVVVELDGVRCEGHALGATAEQVHVGWSAPDGSRQLGWLPVIAVTFG